MCYFCYIAKQCSHDVIMPLNPNVTYVYLNTLTPTCPNGTVFDIDYWEYPDGGRFTLTSTVTCEDDPDSATAVWSADCFGKLLLLPVFSKFCA